MKDNTDKLQNLWGGRFSGRMENDTALYNESLSFDHILYPYSIRASIAHVTMLAKQGIVSNDHKEQIVAGLLRVKEKLDRGEAELDIQDEDIMMTVEKLLTEEIGEAGKRLHTARSRNDQNVVDEKLFLRDAVKGTMANLADLLETIIKKAESQRDVAMPGFTHMQHAQPITAGFYYMAHFQGLRRDAERFLSSFERLNQNPLGACALAGTTLPTDRLETTRLLGFGAPTENALDSVGDRDFIAEYLFNAAMCMIHLSGFAEEIILFNSQEFSFIEIHDSFCTGSSIMPQKKNPDIAELVRGKSGRACGNLMSVLMMLKGTVLTLNKDYQEDKEPLFDSIKTVDRSLHIFARMLEQISFREEILRKHLKEGFITATDLAEDLAAHGVPFRDAHEAVGKLVKYCELQGKYLEDITGEELTALKFPIHYENLNRFTVENCIANRKSYGGTSPEDVNRQIENGKRFLGELKGSLLSL